MPELVLLWPLAWIASALGAYVVARRKHARRPVNWGVIGLLLGPLGVLWAALRASPNR
jgi:hypothetical protein